ncbi:protein of unknown function [Methylorubrum extorquens]|uniref:Uncharacterized protein n=1 Tax=Methylorubrum extorquens TaxID=408 RepID=A0A2N9AL53_METEX|nr:protein of unknown function [Methylorubrum extorquens]
MGSLTAAGPESRVLRKADHEAAARQPRDRGIETAARDSNGTVTGPEIAKAGSPWRRIDFQPERARSVSE